MYISVLCEMKVDNSIPPVFRKVLAMLVVINWHVPINATTTVATAAASATVQQPFINQCLSCLVKICGVIAFAKVTQLQTQFQTQTQT